MAYADHRIPAANLIGEPGRGLPQILGVLEVGRINIAARAVGVARAAFDAALAYAQQRVTIGKPIAEHQAIQLKLADMATKLEAARLLTRNAAERKAAGLRCDVEAGMAKLFASETALELATESMRIHGGVGLHDRAARGALLPRRAADGHRRGHQRDPAHRHRPGSPGPRAARPRAEMDPAAGATRHSGTRVHRVEDARLLTGKGTYVDDIVRPGMLHACFVRSPFPRARIRRDRRECRARAPGGAGGVHRRRPQPGVQELWYTGMGPQAPTTPLPPLAEGEARFVGDPVVLVVAVDRYVAEDAAELVEIEWTELPAAVDYEFGADSEHVVHEGFAGNVVGGCPVATARRSTPCSADAHLVVEEDVFEQMYAAVPMETARHRGRVGRGNRRVHHLGGHSGPQRGAFRVLSRVTGLPEHRIRVIMRDTGGAFGQKVVPGREDVAVMLAAQLVPAPLKWIEDRRENLLAAGQSRHEHAHTTFAFADDGTLLAAAVDHVQDCGAYPIPWPVGTGAAVGMMFPGPYRIPAAAFGHRSVFSHTAGRTAYRGPWAFESMAREVVLDVAARRLDLDPVELRRRNMLTADELPYANAVGMPYAHMSPRETFDHALEILDYDQFRRQQADARAEGRYLGVGTCSYVEPTTPGVGYYGSEGATIRIDPSGKVLVYVAGGSSGNSLETTVVQLTADALGVPMSDVATIQGDTALTPYGAGTGGSRSGSMLAGAVTTTAQVLRERLVAIAAHSLEAAPEDIDIADGRAFVRGTPASGITVAEIAAKAYYQPAMLPPGLDGGSRRPSAIPRR